jgi:acetylornithine deacetylase
MPSSASTKSPTLELLKQLVAFDTTSHLPNLGLIAWAADYLAKAGFAVHLLPSVGADVSSGKANLLAIAGDANQPAVMLTGHSDVVPVADQAWDSDPFALTVRGDRAYGRGSCDMKGFLASVLAAAPAFGAAAKSGRLKQPLAVVMTFDEETLMTGADEFLAHLQGMTAKPAAIIIGEPTNMQVVEGHKSSITHETIIHGLGAHSSNPMLGANALLPIAEVLQFIDQMAVQAAANPIAGSRFDPPYTTFNLGVLTGGTAHNITAPRASLIWQMRTEPSDDWQDYAARFDHWLQSDLMPRWQKIHPAFRAENHLHEAHFALKPTANNPAAELAAQLTGHNQRQVVAYCTEGGVFQQADIPIVICGPGSIDQAHQANEWVALDQLQQCDRFMERLLTHLQQG